MALHYQILLLTDYQENDYFKALIHFISGRFEENIVKERQESAANFLRYVARNSVLCKSLHVKKFFEVRCYLMRFSNVQTFFTCRCHQEVIIRINCVLI